MAYGERPALETQVKAQLEGNSSALGLFSRIASSSRFIASCEMANSVAVNRLGYNDHGYTHVRIVAANALRILNLLKAKRITPTFVSEKHGDFNDAQAVVLLGALFHDIGNAIHREHHQELGVHIAGWIMEEILPGFYSGAKLQKVKLAALGCVFEHDESVQATSIEAGVVKVADGTDCETGRARIPYRMFGKTDIHSVSALAIRRVDVLQGRKKPVRVVVDMSNPSGLFQIEEVLGKKISSSGPMRELVEVFPLINGKHCRDTDITKI